MSSTLEKKRRLALAAAVLGILTGMMGYAAARAQVAGKHGHVDHGQIAVIKAERDAALAALADASKRHRIARNGIARLVEELVYVEQLNATLQGEATPAADPQRGIVPAGR